jgi:predicted amidohydrolase YtcJ
MRSLNSNERFTLDEALNAYLSNNLPFIYEDHLPEADYIIIDQDIYQSNLENIKNIKVLKTVINGVEVFSKKEK